MSRYSSTEREGVNETERIVVRELGLIFREQPIVDMGVDAHIEIVEENNPTGKLIGVQIKTGASHFTITNKNLVYYGDNIHLEYWLAHSLPIIIVAYLPEEDKTYWQHISEDTIVRTPKGWKVNIPLNQDFSSESKERLLEISKGSPQEQKMNKLFFDKDLMLHIKKGGKINVYTEDWLHKSLGRGVFHVILIDENGKEQIIREWGAYYTYTLIELLQHYFPWADFENDEDFFDMNFDEDSVSSFYDTENDKIFAYEVVDGEAGRLRINLTLNNIGKAFLALQEYLNQD